MNDSSLLATNPSHAPPVRPAFDTDLALRGTLIVACLCLIGVSMSLWRLTSNTIAASREQQQHWEQFHHELLGEIRNLTSAVDLAGTGELSTVRFRFRSGGFLTPPHMQTRVVLQHLGSESIVRSEEISERTDFGWLPPGPYLLHAAFDIYQLAWEFEVRPGIPFDRTVLVPNSVPAHGPQIEIRRRGAPRRLPGVCLVRGRPVILDQWTWEIVDPLVLLADPRMSESELALLIEADPILEEIMRVHSPRVVDRLPFLHADVLSVHAFAQPLESPSDTSGDFACESHEFAGGLAGLVSATEVAAKFGRRHTSHDEQLALHWSVNDYSRVQPIVLPPVSNPL